MQPDPQLQTSFWVMVVLQTIGSVDAIPGAGARKMPAPGVYVPVLFVWSVLQIASDAGWQQGARIMGWVVVATGAVVGPFGQKAVNLFRSVAALYAVPPTPKVTPPGGASTTVTPQPPVTA